jgi:hypothetical protein
MAMVLAITLALTGLLFASVPTANTGTLFMILKPRGAPVVAG